MGDKIKRTADNAAIGRKLDAALPKVWNPPRCHCGELATVEVNLHSSVTFYCTKHLPPDALQPPVRKR